MKQEIKLIKICEKCGKETKNLKSHIWRSHTQDGIAHNKKGFSGKKHNLLTREKLKISRVLQEPPIKKGQKIKSGHKHTDEFKQNLSRIMVGNTRAHHRGDRQSFYFDIRMDSSWEVKTAKYLDDCSFNWKYSNEKYILSNNTTYTPDFHIYDENHKLKYIIEVKGYFRESNRLKFKLFKKNYPDLKIYLWDKSILKFLKIL